VGLVGALASLAIIVATVSSGALAQTSQANTGSTNTGSTNTGSANAPSSGQSVPAARPQSIGAASASVRRRPRLDFESYGIALDEVVGNDSGVARAVGSFDLYTQVESAAGYTSNLYKRDTDQQGSSIARIRPQVALRSDWARHELNLIAVGDLERASASDDDNVEGGRLRLEGRLDGPEGVAFRGGTSVSSGYLGRDSDLDLGPGFGRIPVKEYGANLEYEDARSDRLPIKVQATGVVLDYDSVQGISFDGSDRSVGNLNGEIGIAPGLPFAFTLNPGVQRVVYSDSTSSDSTRYSMAVGAAWADSEITAVRGVLGGSFRSLDDGGNSIDVLSRLDALWNVTPIMTLSANASIENTDTSQANASSELEQKVGLRLDYDPTERLILTVGTRFERSEIDGSDRQDDKVVFDLGATYLLNEHAFVRAGIQHTDQSSNGGGRAYTDTTGVVSLGFKLCCLKGGGFVPAF
jgi:hypothetical protein